MSRIVLIAPDFFNRQDYAMCLEAKGHATVLLKDVTRAIDTVLSDPPDLLVLQKGLHMHLDSEVVQALKNNLQLALLPIILIVSERDIAAGIDWSEYPVDDVISSQAAIEELITRVDLALDRKRRIGDNNPLTQLPGNTSILKNMQNVIDEGIEAAVGYVDIDSFKPFNDRYGFSRGDEVIRMVSRVLVNVIREHAGSRGFVGHIGGDDFVFIVPLAGVEDICREILNNFSALIPLFLDESDIEAGFFLSADRQGNKMKFPLTTLSIAVVPCVPGRFLHFGEIASNAAGLKKKVKSMDGSNFMIDRRGSIKKG